MKILIVSRDAEPHLWSSSAHFTRMKADALAEKGWEIRVVCASTLAQTIDIGKWTMTTLPVRNNEYRKGFLSDWLPNERVRKHAETVIDEFVPDVVFIGAWNTLLEFGLVAAERGIPVVHLAHDVSIFCVLIWLVNYAEENCIGPESVQKCIHCVRVARGKKDRIRSAVLSIPFAGYALRKILPENNRNNIHMPSRVAAALENLSRYRQSVSLFILQSPHLLTLFEQNGIERDRCRFLYQFVGREKMAPYPRAAGKPGIDRAIRFIYIGRWSEPKGSMVLEEAFRRAQMQHPAELWVVSRNLPDEVRRRAGTDYFGERKSFAIFEDLEGARLAQHLAQADICIVPSIGIETASSVVFEAHAQGVPVVATESVGNKFRISDEVNGKIIAIASIDELRFWIEKIAAQPEIIAEWSKSVLPPPTEAEWKSTLFAIMEEAAGIAGDRKVPPPTGK